METQKLLLAEVNAHGSFLIRESESVPNTYALSLRDTDTVRHYKIKRLDSGGFFISKNHDFDSLQSLVAFYLEEPEGLCCKLVAPCIKVCFDERFFTTFIIFAEGGCDLARKSSIFAVYTIHEHITPLKEKLLVCTKLYSICEIRYKNRLVASCRL